MSRRYTRSDCISKDRSGNDPDNEACYQFIKSHQEEYTVLTMCRVLGVPRSGYYKWLKKPKENRWQRADAELAEKVKAIQEQSTERFSGRRMLLELRSRGIRVSPKRVNRVMSNMGLLDFSARGPKPA